MKKRHLSTKMRLIMKRCKEMCAVDKMNDDAVSNIQDKICLWYLVLTTTAANEQCNCNEHSN
jgi:hypothetical protein